MIDFMQLALDQAALAAARDEVPVGAVLVRAGQVVVADGNRVMERNDPTAHAEMLAIRAAAGRLGRLRLDDCDLYVTLEPCPMCATAIALARLRRLYFGAYDPKGGGVDHGARVFDRATCHHHPEIIGGVRERDAAAQLRAFFRHRR